MIWRQAKIISARHFKQLADEVATPLPGDGCLIREARTTVGLERPDQRPHLE